MKPENTIEVKDLTKKFKVYFDKGSSFKEKILFRSRNRYEERWVLNGISFEVKKGEAIGLIGHNGCGKSTTLKLLSKIIYPDSGTIEMRGRVSSLIELGAGFHPDMSGKENIYINAAIFGLSKKEINSRLEEIIAFSELGNYIDNPVRTYSSGMYMRLAFSIAINVDADILLVDEILAVGDAHFQEKCFNKLREIKRQGATIVIVSHSLGQIEEICERTIWIDKGKIAMEGIPFEVHPKYMEYMQVKETPDRNIEKKSSKEKDIKKSATEKIQSGNAKINKVTVWDEKGVSYEIFHSGQAGKMEIEYQIKEYLNKAIYGIDVKKDGWMRVYGTDIKSAYSKEMSLDIRESDYLYYLTDVTNTANDLLDQMCINEHCEKKDDGIIIRQGGNMWGPYIKVEPMLYKLEICVRFPESQNVILSVTAKSGEILLKQFVLKQGTNKLQFEIKHSVENLEFVINNPEKTEIFVEQILLA